jgi:hypothetical protein
VQVWFQYGAPGDLPVTGDWHGLGADYQATFAAGRFYLGGGPALGDPHRRLVAGDLSWGDAGQIPVAGNWWAGQPAGIGVVG